MFGLTRNQVLGSFVVVCSVLMISTAQLTDLFGPTTAKAIVSATSILNGILGGWVTMMGSAGQQLRDVAALDPGSLARGVAALPGIDRVVVNTIAAPSLAAAAVDPGEPKVAPASPSDRVKLQQIASA
jgi:hypothetical protein